MAKKRPGRKGGPSPLIVLYGEARTLTEWCREYGVSPNTVMMRVTRMGWDWERAIVKSPLRRGPEKGRKMGPKLGRVRGYRPPCPKGWESIKGGGG